MLRESYSYLIQFGMIQFDMVNVLGGNWDPTDKTINSVNSETAEFE